MAWKPILVGVDGSHEAANAAALAWSIGQTTRSEFHVVHAIRDILASVRDLSLAAAATASASALPVDEGDAWTEAHHLRIKDRIAQTLPDQVAQHLRIEVGRAAAVLTRQASKLDAGLVVVGGKHHSRLGRWVVGSTAHHLIRVLDVPLLVVGDTSTSISRILVAVDLSEVAADILLEAQRWAAVFESALRAVHVVDVLPASAPCPPHFSQEDFYDRSKDRVEETIWPKITTPSAEKVVLTGPIIPTILDEARDWGADLLVVGSHGKGWEDRMLLGSTTEALVNDLPASLMIVPVT